jgi:glycosyltransferase involved in cell wall biosynthesis
MEKESPGNKLLKVLFVCSGINEAVLSPVVSAQGESLRKKGVSVDYFTIGGKGFTAYLKASIILRKRLKSQKYNIIHAHYGLSAMVALAGCDKTPLVVSFMGDDILGSNRTSGKVTRASRWLSRINVLLARYLYDFNIVKSEEMLLKLGNNRKSAIIPNGVDIEVFRPISKNEAWPVAGFSKERGNYIFIGDQARPEKNYKLALEAVNRAGNDFNLHTLNDKKPWELVFFYNAADAVLITSFHEGSPNILKEAMACNCPVVATDVGDIRILSEGLDGHYLTLFDPTHVAGCLIAALQFRQEMGETKGRVRIVERRLDSGSVALQIISIYRRLVLS